MALVLQIRDGADYMVYVWESYDPDEDLGEDDEDDDFVIPAEEIRFGPGDLVPPDYLSSVVGFRRIRT